MFAITAQGGGVVALAGGHSHLREGSVGIDVGLVDGAPPVHSARTRARRKRTNSQRANRSWRVLQPPWSAIQRGFVKWWSVTWEEAMPSQRGEDLVVMDDLAAIDAAGSGSIRPFERQAVGIVAVGAPGRSP